MVLSSCFAPTSLQFSHQLFQYIGSNIVLTDHECYMHVGLNVDACM